MSEILNQIFTWNLKTAYDYLIIVVILGFSVLLLGTYIVILNHHRNDKCARQRVIRKFGRILGDEIKIERDREFMTEEGKRIEVSCMITAAWGILLLRVYGWGLHVSGSVDRQTWVVRDRVNVKCIENPIPEMERAVSSLKTILGSENKHIPIEYLIVFADNYDHTEINIEGADYLISYEQLNRWIKTWSLQKGVISQY